MLVCGHGDVSDYCTKYGMVIVYRHKGDIQDYNGMSRVIVTDSDISESEYVYMKSVMLRKGYELVSTKYTDTEQIARLVAKFNSSRRKYGGRCKFGYHRVNGELVVHPERMKVVRRILELKDKGCTLREIREDEGVHHTDGRKLSLSTIQIIIGNRKDYEL